MNRERAKELLPIIQAFAEGKEIEASAKSNGKAGGWVNVKTGSIFEEQFPANTMDYRIKPEPREFWLNISPDGIGFSSYEEAKRKADEYIASARLRGSQDDLTPIKVRVVDDE